MFNSGNSDFTMPVVPAGYANNGNANGWGDGGWWVLIILFAIFGGWGGNGFGNGNGFGGMLTRADLCQDTNFAQLENGVRGISQGICDSTFALNNSINGVNTNMLQGFAGVDNAICSLGFQTQQGFNGTNMAIAQLGFQNQQCCCDTQKEIIQNRFDASQNTCAITNAIHAEGEQTRALINANTMQDLRDKIADKDRDLLAANFQISQVAQTSNIINQIKPCPIPAYLSCSPYQSFGPYGYGGGYNNGCDCNRCC